MDIFERMLGVHAQPNVIVYKAAISACEYGRQLQQALVLFQTMPGAHAQPNIITYNAAMPPSVAAGGSVRPQLQVLDLFRGVLGEGVQ